MATVVITGASRGIALEMAKQCMEAGDRVYAMCRTPANATALNELAAKSGGKLTVHQMDVNTDESVKAGAAQVDADTVDVLYNVAGVLGPTKAELELGSSDWTAWTDTINTMTYGPVRSLQAFMPKLKEGSKVISITSQLAASTWPYGGLYPYVAAKAALNRVMRSISIDLKGKGIIVGVMHPGWVKTDMSGPNADITPEESAEGVRKTTEKWTMAETGDFFKWNGERHAW